MDEQSTDHEVLDGEIVLATETALQAQPSVDRTPVRTRSAVPMALAAASGFALGATAVALITRRQIRALAEATPVPELERGPLGGAPVGGTRNTYFISIRALVSSD